MKAILILDEMPEECISDTKQCGVFALTDWGPICTKTGKEVNWQGKPDWCPLRPAPEKREFPYSVEALERICDELDFNREAACGYVVGWNACIDAITGEDEE